ncbi:site-2 protease family protein [Luedemannella flava]|uniref:Site-2 protease family protein n=1 Tax=Luedemannella flava TaxID=349316 RepID=A0ABP4YUM6_9ACTN
MGPHQRHIIIGGNRDLFRPSAVFLGVVALFITGGVMAWRGYGNIGFDVFLFVVAGWIVSLCLHEYAHALIAYRAGDVQVAAKGYLTLNPLRYAHPILSVVLPVVFLLLGGIGLPGGAVWIDHHAIRSKVADSLISLSGPATNLLFAGVLAAPFWLGVDVAAHPGFWSGVAFLGFLQVSAGVLNLMPLPGLDGGNALRPWLRGGGARMFDLFAPYGMLLLFALLFEPRVNQAFFAVVDTLADAIGLPTWLSSAGNNLMRFWR